MLFRSPTNDGPSFLNPIIYGRGLSLFGTSYGGTGSINGPNPSPQGDYIEDDYGMGYKGGNGSGQVATKFQLYQADTIYGYRVYWGELNQGLDWISFAIYRDANQPGELIEASQTLRRRGMADDATEYEGFGKYVTYYLQKPLVLSAGNYWMSVAQKGETEIGRASYRERV